MQNNKARRGRQGRKGASAPRALPMLTAVPQSKRIVQTFSATNAITEPSAGAGFSYFYRLNSVYDPDSSGVGTTAGGYSTWASLFLNYKVRRVTVRFQGTAALSNNSMAQITLAPVPNQAVIPSNPRLWVTIPGAKALYTAPNVNGGKNVVEHTMNLDLAKVARVTRQQYETDMDFSGAVGSNPARQIYFFVSIAAVGSTTPATLYFALQITYEVEWFNPVPMQF